MKLTKTVVDRALPRPRRYRLNDSLVGYRRLWLALLEEAGVADLRVHDLRHTFASYSLSGGQTLGTVGQLLGHRSTQTTSRYTHLVDDAARAAVERVSDDLGM
jgi:integrase